MIKNDREPQSTVDPRLPHNPPTMAIREFTDSSGVKWRVWSTVPRVSGIYDMSLRAGWLTFESASGRRRLAPIPRGWQDADAARLELMCRSAEVTRRTGLTPDPDAPDASVGGDEPPTTDPQG
jgi:hypothetical protein